MTNNNNTPTITFDCFGEDLTVFPDLTATYSNGRVAIMLISDEGPAGSLTTNLPDQHLNPGEVFIKDWSENAPAAQAAIDAGWLIPTGREVQSGFVFPKVMRLGEPLLALLS